jgi:hypothetical protein
VQVLVLLYVVGMQITDTILILIIQGGHLEVVILATGTIMVDFKILHPLMLEEEVLMGLDLVQDLIEGRAWVGIIQMYAQGKATGSAQILCKFIFHCFLLYGFTLHSSTPFFVFSRYLILALLGH